MASLSTCHLGLWLGWQILLNLVKYIMSRGWLKTSACCFQVCLSWAVFCQVVSFQYSSKSSLHLFAGLPRNLFLPYGFEVVMRFVHLSSLSRLMCSAQDHFILLVVFITSVTPVFALTQVFVFLSWYVTLSILLSIFSARLLVFSELVL